MIENNAVFQRIPVTKGETGSIRSIWLTQRVTVVVDRWSESIKNQLQWKRCATHTELKQKGEE